MVGTITWLEALCFVLGKLAAVRQVWAEAGGGREAGHRLWPLLPSTLNESASSLGLPNSHCLLTAADVTKTCPHGTLEAGHSLISPLEKLRGLESLVFN